MQTPRVFCCSDRIAKRFARHNLSVGVQCETFLAKRHAPKLQFLRGADDMDRACRRVAKTCHTCAAVPPKALKAWFQNAVKTSQDQLMSRKLKVAIFHCGESAPWPWTWLTKSLRILSGSYPALLSSKILQLSTFQDLYDHVWPHPSTCTETWKVTRKHLTHRSARLRRSLLTQGMRFRHLPRKGIVHTLVMWCHVPPSLGRDCGALWCQQGDQRCDPKITKAFQGIPRHSKAFQGIPRHQKPAGSDGKSLPCQRALPSTGRT